MAVHHTASHDVSNYPPHYAEGNRSRMMSHARTLCPPSSFATSSQAQPLPGSRGPRATGSVDHSETVTPTEDALLGSLKSLKWMAERAELLSVKSSAIVQGSR
mmetsp:Transcript_25962/g.35046  ORF Transcript_25962/g.35046 Transcript_25962/m.35046 type:complete len:103 (+) Transcript_25962:44-352(+)